MPTPPVPPALVGRHVRLEPLGPEHVPGLAAAAAQDPALYEWTSVPQGESAMAGYVRTALSWRAAGTAVPFAVVRLADETVVGSSRLWELEHWPWPPGHPLGRHPGPDVAEIGHTWLAASAVRTAVNSEMKLLMLGLAFDGWGTHRVCFHTDARNDRSRTALAGIGARFEGVLRAHRMGADLTLRDSARFSVTAAEWPAVRDRLTARVAR